MVLTALPALSGLVVCATATGVMTSWSERPCLRKATTASPLVDADSEDASACAVVPDAEPAPLPAAPDVSAPVAAALAAPVTEVPHPSPSGHVAPDGPRGPPGGALDALRTIVLRV